MKILAAFDKYKESMTAEQACSIAAHAARKIHGSDCEIIESPLTDGGEGFCAILTKAASGKVESHTVIGPLGQPVRAPIGWVSSSELPCTVLNRLGNCPGRLAIIEMASAAGLQQVPPEKRHPSQTTTWGVGQLIRIAAEQGAGAILLGIGGSATSDLGLGALEALGIEFPPTKQVTPGKWPQIQKITGYIQSPLPPIYIACDVDNPLLGHNGAASIYGPQKGLLPNEVASFEEQSDRLSTRLCQHFGHDLSIREIPGSGAAGGLGFGLHAACGAEFLPGFDLVQSWLDLEMQIALSDLVLTGEGCFDQSSLSGKGPFALLELAEKAGTPVHLLPGRVESGVATRVQIRFPGIRVTAITSDEYPLAQALAEGPENLSQTVTRILQERPPNAS
ncbi:MAG: glycerate kinase [Coraliomargaritaceae bacterium]